MDRIKDFLKLLRELQKIDPEFPLQYAVALSVISLNEGLSISKLAEETKLSMSTVSRIVGALSNTRQKGEPYGLVRVQVSAQERRRKEIYLTTKGHLFIDSIDALLENKKTADSVKPRIARAI
tara:strand:+ start:5076 stop:5444 length:369 start_codon:yes stop_codon:yes gene_type:complete